MTTFYDFYTSPIGNLRIESDGESITSIKIVKVDEYCVKPLVYVSVIDDCIKFLRDYFSGKNPKADFPIKPSGSEFCIAVWKELAKVGYGESVSYGELAKRVSYRLNRRTSPRAVGRAVGKNPILILIPCHRVLAANFKLGGFSAGLENKKLLLSLEKIKYYE